MKRLTILFLMCFPFFLPAQVLKLNKGQFETSGSGFLTQGEMGLNARFGVFVKNYVQVGAGLTWADNEYASRTHFGIHSYKIFETRTYLLPYTGAALGFGSLEADNGFSDSGMEFTVMSGVKYYVANNVSLNAELQLGLSSGETYLDDDEASSTHVGLVVGLSYLW